MPDREPMVLEVTSSGSPLLGGYTLFEGDLEDLLDRLEELLPAERALAVITPNVDQTINLQDDPLLRHAFSAAEIRIADGTPLVLLGRLLGARRLHRLTGADLLIAAASRSKASGWRIVITGGRPEVADLAVAYLRRDHGADVHAVPFPHIANVADPTGRQVVDALAALRPDLVFVCLGSPKQDVWVDHWRDALPPAVYVGAGAAVDFAAGVKARAPRAVQAVGLEWVYRLAQEPRRLARRYLVRDPLFIGIVVRSALRRARRLGSGERSVR